jgi:hypothetical protein
MCANRLAKETVLAVPYEKTSPSEPSRGRVGVGVRPGVAGGGRPGLCPPSQPSPTRGEGAILDRCSRRFLEKILPSRFPPP